MKWLGIFALTGLIFLGSSQAQAAGRSQGAVMSASQKAAAAKSATAKLNACKRSANSGKLHFSARRAFIKDCLAR